MCMCIYKQNSLTPNFLTSSCHFKGTKTVSDASVWNRVSEQVLSLITGIDWKVLIKSFHRTDWPVLWPVKRLTDSDGTRSPSLPACYSRSNKSRPVSINVVITCQACCSSSVTHVLGISFRLHHPIRPSLRRPLRTAHSRFLLENTNMRVSRNWNQASFYLIPLLIFSLRNLSVLRNRNSVTCCRGLSLSLILFSFILIK